MSRLSSPHALLMIRPAQFGYNQETALSNTFQQTKNEKTEVAHRQALAEFDAVVAQLKNNQIEVLVVPDTPEPNKPDAIFPNNWISTHQEGWIIVYPMMAPNRRLERRSDIVELLKARYQVTDLIDFSVEEKEGKFLEGTGSIVFDHINKIAYACRSPRTNEEVLKKLCQRISYQPIVFDSIDEAGKPIYHTNVMMWIGEKMAGLCLDSIKAGNQQEMILNKLAETGYKVIAISYKQMKSFAGNMFEVKNTAGKTFLLMSKTAHQSLLPGQLKEINKHAEPLIVNIETIEQYGGGGIRCMVAGIYLY